MKKDNYVYILHIRDSNDKILEYTMDTDYEKFEQQTIIQDALIRKFEIIGEAASKLSKDFKDKYDIVPWKKVIGMRNNLIHDYFGVDIKIIWDTVKNDIPGLKNNIYKITVEEFPNIPLKFK